MSFERKKYFERVKKICLDVCKQMNEEMTERKKETFNQGIKILKCKTLELHKYTFN